MDKQILHLTRAEYNIAKANRTLVCPNVCKITDEGNHTENLINNPKADIGIATYEAGLIKFYSAEEYAALSPRPVVLGDYVLLDDKIIILHSEVNSSVKWSNTLKTVPGCFISTSQAAAILDMGGQNNTDAVLTAISNEVIADAPAFTWASQRVWADGVTGGYVLGAGELEIIRLNSVAINQCRALHNAEPIFTANGKWYWSSSQNGADLSWNCQLSSWVNYHKNYAFYCLAARAL